MHASRKLAIAVLITAGTFALRPQAAPAQFAQFQIINGRIVQPGESDTEQPRLLVDTNRSLSRQFERAKEALQTDKFREAIQFLQEGILDRSEDYFVDQDMKMSLKREALKLIATLPDEARRHYDLQYGRVAEQMLADAKETRDVAQLEEIARRFFHTAAGYEATYLLGTHYLDRSSPFAAALQFQQLRQMPEVSRQWEPLLSLKTAVAWGRAGLREKSIETLQQLKDASNDGRISYRGREIRLFEANEDPIAWLVTVLGEQQEFAGLTQESWAMFRGDAARNATAAPATPVWDGAWSLATITRPDSRDAKRLEDVAGRLRKLEDDYRQSSFLTLPAAHPLVVGDVVVFRTLSNLRAVHLTTGELLWETAIIDPSYEYLVEQSNDMPVQPNQPSIQQMYLTQRAWRDMTAGTLSTDGEYVYSLEDLGFIGPFGINPNAPQHILAPKDYNRLMAFELATGKIKWEVGGPRGDYALEQAGTYFLGPPLPLGKELYCLAEYSGEIRLVVLDADSGEQKWSQTLILPQASLPLYPLRRLAGLSPSYADGVMVCATAGGAVVAVDLTRRLVMWGHQYSHERSSGPLNRAALIRARMMNRFNVDSSDDEARWIDSLPTIAEGRVLLTSRDSDELICLKLLDGTVEWKRPRGQSLYVAGVHDGRVILVGRTLVESLRLTDGSNAWSEPLPIPMPSGRGVRSGSLYHIPLSTAEVATIDLDSGRIIARSAARTGIAPGNLVAAGGVLVSQTIDAVTGYRPLPLLEQQIEEQLRKNAQEAAALALRGEMRLHQGLEQDGLADLRQSIERDPKQSRAREVLVAALLEGLRFDFAKYRTTTEEIEKLAEDPQQKARFLRLYAAGLQQVGEHEAAFESFLKLARAETGDPQLERLSASLSVRSDRWVRPRIQELYEAAKPAQQAAMTDAIRRQLDAALEADDPGELRKFLNCFAGLPMAAEARRALAGHLDGDEQQLGLELNLRELHRAEDPAMAAFAAAELAELYLDVKKGAAAADLLEELATRWADHVIRDDKTGKQLAEEWRASETAAPLLAEAQRWPENHIEARRTGRRGNIERDHTIEFLGPRGPFTNWSLAIDNRRQNLIARDAFGIERWKLAITGLKDPRNPDDRTRNVPNIYGNNVRVHGHLMVVTLGSYFIVLDVLSDEEPRLLWLRDLYETSGNPNVSISTQFRAMPRGGGRQKFVITDAMQRPMGTVGSITDEQLTYQVGTTLYAADILTGDILWERRNISRGSEIFGDRDSVFVVPQNSKQAMVLRSGDGEYVGTRELPGPEAQLLQDGRHLVIWTVKDDKATLARLDALTGTTAWTRSLPGDTLVTDVQGDELALLEPGGRFEVVALKDGKPRLEAQLDAENNLQHIHVFRARDRYILLTHKPEPQPRVRAVAVTQNMLQINGMAYGFDRATGRKLWQTRVENQTFDPSQPSELPVLVFSVRLYRVFQNGRVINPNQYAVKILDARNGETVFEDDGTQPLSPFLVRVHPEQKKLEIDFYQSVVELTLGETTLDTPRDSPAEAEKPAIP